MANFGALGTLRHAYRTLNKPLDLCPSPISLSEQEFSVVSQFKLRHDRRLRLLVSSASAGYAISGMFPSKRAGLRSSENERYARESEEGNDE
jgi:hypothetical protein